MHGEYYTLCAFVVRLRCARVVLHAHTRSFPGDFFTAAFQCPHRLGGVGTLGDGGKRVCGLDRVARQKQCVIYSFGLSISTLSTPQVVWPHADPRATRYINLTGINGESSFERDLLRAPGCEAWGYDYSVGGVRFRVSSPGRHPTYLFSQWGHEISDDPGLRRRVHFQTWALGDTDKHEEGDNPKYCRFAHEGACSHFLNSFQCEN